MEEGESVLEAIYEVDEVAEDVEMVDVEEGELLVLNPQIDQGQSSGGGVYATLLEFMLCTAKTAGVGKIRRKIGKREVCGRYLWTPEREKLLHGIYYSVGCLGISALSDLVKEVDAIQSCGGQMTADGRRLRTGGGISWNIMKTREPMAYKEIIKKAKDFEVRNNINPVNILKPSHLSTKQATSM
ncbi:hypothetical protein GH714_013006 [Hevea brasiliensis]|uniref:Phosphorylated adapter RNA export protein n=1 Tax=Hevea brasiliensis TaxID=3981 RepID=A0A6A6KFH5_HEVBR|nr:hypothetical protein GH714_013006 [Hevea brasiliensis]